MLKNGVYTFFIIVCIAIFSPFIANDKPLVCKYQGEWLFPAFSLKNQHITTSHKILNYNMGIDWKLIKTDFSIFPLCAYSPNTIDATNAPRKSPFDKQYIVIENNQMSPLPYKFRHWLGTTQNGNDVLAGIIHGAKISLSVGVFSMLIAGILGVFLGAIAGYFENNSLKIGYVQLLFLMISLFLIYFFYFVLLQEYLSKSIEIGGISIILPLIFSGYLTYFFIKGGLRFGYFIDTKLQTHSKLNFPIDTIVSKIIETINSIPSLLLIIAISAIAKPSYALLILIIGFFSWTNVARLTRAEFLKTKQLDYVTACKALGMNDYRIILKHILPNVFPILLVQIIFGMAGAVLIESSLSFIGIGVPTNTVTWGRLLNEAQNHFSAWWLVVFPGLCIFILIYTYNKIATEISK